MSCVLFCMYIRFELKKKGKCQKFCKSEGDSVPLGT